MKTFNLTAEYERACECGNKVTKDALDDAVAMFRTVFSKPKSAQHLVLVKGLLNRITSGLPLTPITMEDFDNTVASEIRGELKHTCARYEGLTATKNSDGNGFTYSDSRRVVFYDQSLINQEESSSIVDILHNRAHYPSIALKLVDDLFPITLPYMPGDKYEVFGSSYSFKLAEGEPDLVEIDFIKTPNGQLVKVDQYYRKTRDGKYIEVDFENFKHYRTFGAVDLNYKWIRCLIKVEGPDNERRRVDYFAAKDIVEEENGELSGVVVGRISYTDDNAPYETDKVIDSFEVFPLVNHQYTLTSPREPLYIREIDKIVPDDEIMQLIENSKMSPKLEEADVRPVLKTMFGAMNKYFAEHRA